MKKTLIFLLVCASIGGGCAQVGPDVTSADAANNAIKNAPVEERFASLKSAPLSQDQKIQAIKSWNISEEEKSKYVEKLSSEGSRGPEAPR